MISKRFTAFLIIFTLLVSLTPSGIIGTVADAAASASSPVPKDGKLHVLDFTSSYTFNSTQTNGTYELSAESDGIDTGKTKSMKWTFTPTETKISFNLLHQREHWPEGADLTFRIYNPQDYPVTFVLLFFQESGYVGTNTYREYATMSISSGWNTYTVSQSNINNKIPASDNVSVMFNIGGFRKNGQYNYNAGDFLYISGAYLEYPNYGQNIPAPTPSIENGAGYVASDLGNNNTYTLNFSEALWDGSHIEGSTTYNVDDYVTVYERNGSTYSETTQNYDVSVDSTGGLDIAFDSALTNGIYKVVANSDAIFTATGKKLAVDSEFYFSVGLASVIFTATSTDPSVASGVMANEPGFEYTINFNNDIDPFDLENMISVSPDARYNVSGNDKYVKLTFTEALQSNTTYTITVSDDFADTNGSFISGTKTFSFTTAKTIGSDGVIFDASNTTDLNDVAWKTTGSNFTVKKINGAGLLDTSTIEFKKNTTSSLSYTFNLSDKIIPDFTNYNYVNMLVYSSVATDNTINVMFSGNDNNFTASAVADWQGWKTVSVPLSSVTGTVGYTDLIKVQYGLGVKTNYLLIDRVWLSTTTPSPVTLASSEFEDGAYNLDTDLGGDNTYTFTFENDIKDFKISDAVSVKDHNGTSYVDFSDYSVSVSGNKLNIVFSPALAGNQSFNIALDLGKILSHDFAIGNGEVQREFTVGGAPAYFILKDTSVDSGATIDDMSRIELTFNNNPDDTLYVPEYIRVYKDGNAIYNVFKASVTENKVVLSFNKNMESGEYTIKVLPSFADAFGNTFSGDDGVSFTYGSAGASADTLVVFAAETDADFDKLDSDYTKSTEITNLYSQTAKLAYSAGLSSTTKVDGFINRGVVMKPVGMNYLNILAYSPKETENTGHVVLYSDVANNQYGAMKYVLPLDWSGWKVISIPMSSFVKSDTYDAFLFNIGGWQHKDILESGYILFDAIWFSKEAPAGIELSSASFESGYTGAAVGGEILELSFNSTLDENIAPVITLTDEHGTTVTDYTYSIEEKILKIVFGELTASTTYTLTVDGLMSKDFSRLSAPVTMSFKTKADGIFVDTLSYNNKVTNVQLKNLSATEDASVTLVAYAISDDNVLLEKQTKTFTATKNTTTSDSVTFATTEQIKEVKAFVYDRNGKFISKQYLCVNGASVELAYTSKLSGTALAKILSAHVDVNVLEVNAQLAGVSDAAVVEVAKADGTVISANVAKTDTNGKLTYYYVFPDSVPSGTYKVTVTSDNVSDTYNIGYVSKYDRNRLLNLAKGTDAAALALCIKDLKAYIGLSSYTDEQITDLAEVIIANNSDFTTYPEVYEFIQFVVALVNNINSASWGELTGLIEQNSSIFGANTDVAYFVSLGDEQQNAISQILISYLPQNIVSGFLSALGQAVIDYKNTPVPEPEYGSQGSGGGGGSASFPSAPVTNPYTPMETNKVFDDLADANWATDCIMTLYESGVISDAYDKKFRPNDNITREEFVKMVVCAFTKDAATTSHRFADSADDAWYNSYLSVAYSLGITTGYADGTFGVGHNITREDMVTICSRTLEIFGNAIPGSASLNFADTAQISDYAVKYVNAMTSLGIVNGMGDGTFAPKANATRAQAAKVIAKLMELY